MGQGVSQEQFQHNPSNPTPRKDPMKKAFAKKKNGTDNRIANTPTKPTVIKIGSKINGNPEFGDEILNEFLQEIKKFSDEEALVTACQVGNLSAIKPLLQKCNLNHSVFKLCSILHFVVCKGEKYQCEIVKLLLQAGISPMSIASNGSTPLHALVSYQKDEKLSVQLLNALLNESYYTEQLLIVDSNGNIPLHLGAKYNKVQVSAALLEHAKKHNKIERSITSQNVHQETPLHLTQSPAIAKLLLLYNEMINFHTDYISGILLHLVNWKNIHGRTPLHQAISKENIPLIMILLDYNAVPTIVDCLGFSPVTLNQVRASESGQLIDTNLQIKMFELAQKVEGIEHFYEPADDFQSKSPNQAPKRSLPASQSTTTKENKAVNKNKIPRVGSLTNEQQKQLEHHQIQLKQQQAAYREQLANFEHLSPQQCLQFEQLSTAAKEYQLEYMKGAKAKKSPDALAELKFQYNLDMEIIKIHYEQQMDSLVNQIAELKAIQQK